MINKLHGVMPPLATPFKDEEPDLAALQANVSRLNQTALTGYLVLGTNGEAVYLTEAEKGRVIEAVRQCTPPDKTLMVGTGCESTTATVGLTRLAAELGGDCALVLPPHYYKSLMTSERLTDHYRKLADASPIPILIYNMPASTGLNLSPELVAALSGHPNIAGVKDSSGDLLQLSEIIRLKEKDFTVFVGASPMLYPALCLGAAGGILAVANVAPVVCCRIQAAFDEGDMNTALRLHRLLTPLATMVTSGWGVPALKLAMNLAGYQGGRVRSPLTDLTDPEIRAAIEAELGVLAKYEGRSG